MSPAWLRARTLSIYLLVLQGGMAAGSAAWGAVGERWGIPAAMFVSALGLLAGLSTIRHFRLRADRFSYPPTGANESIT